MIRAGISDTTTVCLKCRWQKTLEMMFDPFTVLPSYHCHHPSIVAKLPYDPTTGDTSWGAKVGECSNINPDGKCSLFAAKPKHWLKRLFQSRGTR